MSTPFTPVEGPYTCDFSEIGGYDCMFGAWSINAPTIKSIARLDLWVYGQKSCDFDYHSQEAADTALLLAASWDLLKALERVHSSYLSFLRAGMNPDSDAAENLQQAQEHAIDVIAKAKGEGR